MLPFFKLYRIGHLWKHFICNFTIPMKSFLSTKAKHYFGSLAILLAAILAMTLMSGCAASLTDFGYEGGPTSTININQTINDGFGEPWNIPTNFWPYNPYSTVYSPYSGTFSSSRQYWPK